MKIINNDGIALGTEVIGDEGKDIGKDMCISNISIDLTVGELVKAEMTCIAPKFAVDVLPENVTIIQDTSLLDHAIMVLDSILLRNKIDDDTKTDIHSVRSLIAETLEAL